MYFFTCCSLCRFPAPNTYSKSFIITPSYDAVTLYRGNDSPLVFGREWTYSRAPPPPPLVFDDCCGVTLSMGTVLISCHWRSALSHFQIVTESLEATSVLVMPEKKSCVPARLSLPLQNRGRDTKSERIFCFPKRKLNRLVVHSRV